MSSFDDLSDNSFEDSAFGRDEPPTLDETLYDVSIFTLFLNYMKSQQASQNLLFLKEARLYKFLNEPRSVTSQFAMKIIWNYFMDCSPNVVSVSTAVKNKMKEIAFDPDIEVTLDKDSFSVAYGEVYNQVVPHFRNWISTGEWREAIPFHRISPPSFNIVLTSATLRVLFNKFLKSKIEEDPEGTFAHVFHLWKFCIIANDFREGKYSHASHLESKKKKKSDSGEAKDSTEDLPQTPEEYAKRLYKKYKHQVSLPYDGTIPYSVFIIRALDHSIEEFDKSALYASWISLRQYQGVDYQSKIIHQTLTEDGFAEPPTLAGAMASSMLPFFISLMKGTEHGLNLEFMIDALKFHRAFDGKDPSSGPSKSGSSSGGGMKEEAQRIFVKYLESGDMYCDPRLVEEVRTALNKNGGKNIKANLFRRCGAFIYHRSEHTWVREVRATFAWANKSYDNRCKSAHAIEEEFALSVLPDGIDLQVVPSIDDTLACDALMKDYAEFCGKAINEAFQRFREAYEGFFKAPVHQRKPFIPKLLAAYGDITILFPKLNPTKEFLDRELPGRERITDSVLQHALQTIIRAVAKKYYERWLVEHSMVWKVEPWTPVPSIMFSDMRSIHTLNVIERKIQEEALKGKSGLSRYLAKRTVKKQTVANVRSAPAKQLESNSATVVSTKDTGDLLAFGDIKGVSEQKTSTVDEIVLVVPSLDDTLSSGYLRKLFENSYLSTVLPASDMTLWTGFCEFFDKYSAMKDDDLIESQGAMRKDIEAFCEKFKAVLPNVSAIKERAKKQKILFPQFFRPYETELYSSHHTDYEKGLSAKGWA